MATIVLIQDRILHFVYLISFLQMKTSFLPQTTTHEAARSSSRIRFAFRRSRARSSRATARASLMKALCHAFQVTVDGARSFR